MKLGLASIALIATTAGDAFAESPAHGVVRNAAPLTADQMPMVSPFAASPFDYGDRLALRRAPASLVEGGLRRAPIPPSAERVGPTPSPNSGMWAIHGTIPVGHHENVTEATGGLLSGLWESLASFSPSKSLTQLFGRDPLQTPKQAIHSVAWRHSNETEEAPVMVEEPRRWLKLF